MTSDTTSTVPRLPDDSPARVLPWIAILVGLSIVVGALGGVFWAAVVKLPAYLVAADGSGTMTERGLTEIVSGDAWFVIVGVLIGIGLGLVSWKWFRPLGWPTPLLAIGAGFIAGLVCWQVGQLVGPGNFNDRLAAASPGDLVRMSLELHSWSALAVWAFAAVTPVLLISSLGPDDEEHHRKPRSTRPTLVQPAEPESVDERGVVTADSADARGIVAAESETE